jgi:hypothetical protein
MRKTGYKFLKNDEKRPKNIISRIKKSPQKKAKKSKMVDEIRPSCRSSPFLMMPFILLGIETLGPARYSFVSFWWPRHWPC